MPTIKQRVLGGLEFDGTAGRGLVLFPELDGAGEQSAMRVKVFSVSYSQLTGTTPIATEAVVGIRLRGGDPTDTQIWRRYPSATDPVTQFYLPCNYIVPRPPLGSAVPPVEEWEFVFTTVGKTEDATLIVDYGFTEGDLETA